MTNKAIVERGESSPPSIAAPATARQADEPVLATATPARRIAGQLNRFTGVLLFVITLIIFSSWLPGTFVTGATFKSVAGDQAIAVMLAIGLLFTLSAGQYDLSAAQTLGLSAVIDSSLMVHHGFSPALAALVTVVTCAGIGLVNGVLVAKVGVSSFITTLGMSSVLLAFTSQISHDNFIGPVPSGFQRLASRSPLGLPLVTWYALILAAIVWYALEHTPLGRRVYAIGANADAARLAGIRIDRYVIGSFVATGSFAGLAGVLLAAKIGEVSSSLGPPYLLPAFAACFLGSTQIKLGRFNVWGTVLALYLLATGVKGLQLAGSQLWVTDLFNGVALIGAVSVAVLSQRRTVRPKRVHPAVEVDGADARTPTLEG